MIHEGKNYHDYFIGFQLEMGCSSPAWTITSSLHACLYNIYRQAVHILMCMRSYVCVCVCVHALVISPKHFYCQGSPKENHRLEFPESYGYRQTMKYTYFINVYRKSHKVGGKGNTKDIWICQRLSRENPEDIPFLE